MENLLALETSSAVLSLAVQNSKGKRYSKSFKGPHNHAEKIIPYIDELFKKSKTSLKNTGVFLTGRGPGSFTGLRVGFATLKGFLALEKIPCYGALSLDIIAENKKFKKMPEGSTLAVALDAFRQKIYLRIYEMKNKNWAPLGEVQTLTFDETIAAIPEKSVVTGNALAKYEKEFKNRAKDKKLKFAEEKLWYPEASALIDLFNKKDAKVKQISEQELLPLYFRLSEAEERAAAL